MKSKLTEYIPALDGFRAISIVLVYLSHVIYYSGITTATIIPGGFGVTIFFFISGFLITRLLIAEIQSYGRIDLKGVLHPPSSEALPAAPWHARLHYFISCVCRALFSLERTLSCIVLL